MKKTLLSQAVEVIMAGIMYSAIKVKETRDNLIKSKNYTIKAKNELNSSHQDFITKCEGNIKEPDERIDSH